MLLCAGCGENPPAFTNPPAPTEPEAQGGAATQQELVKYVKEFYENDLKLEILQPVMDEDAAYVYEFAAPTGGFLSKEMELSMVYYSRGGRYFLVGLFVATFAYAA